jgi:hypothetical protein
MVSKTCQDLCFQQLAEKAPFSTSSPVSGQIPHAGSTIFVPVSFVTQRASAAWPAGIWMRDTDAGYGYGNLAAGDTGSVASLLCMLCRHGRFLYGVRHTSDGTHFT